MRVPPVGFRYCSRWGRRGKGDGGPCSGLPLMFTFSEPVLMAPSVSQKCLSMIQAGSVSPPHNHSPYSGIHQRRHQNQRIRAGGAGGLIRQPSAMVTIAPSTAPASAPENFYAEFHRPAWRQVGRTSCCQHLCNGFVVGCPFHLAGAIACCDSIRIASVPPAVAPCARLVLHSCVIPRLCQRGWSFGCHSPVATG